MEPVEDPVVPRAFAFAAEAHGAIDHRRKYSGEPYIEHPAEVMEIVRTVPHTPAMLAAALLHDAIEDTPTTYADILGAFGEEIATLVLELTDQCLEGNRATRKAAEARRLAGISSAAQTVKLADIISNARSIVSHDPDFGKVYCREMAALLSQMTGGDSELRGQALAAIELPQTSEAHRAAQT